MPLSDDPAEHPAVTLARWASFDHDTQVSLLVDSALARGLCSNPNLTECAVRAALDVAEGEDREYLARVVLTGAISMSLPVDLLQVCADCIVVDPTAWTLRSLTENLTRGTAA
jgi:ethanolamine transporter EutH